MSTPSDIATLVEELGSKRGSVRHAARRNLVTLGPAAVPALTQALREAAHNGRWGAAKALGEIGDPSSAPALVAALEDDDSDVRWLAAGALVALRRDGIVPLLVAIRDGKLELWSHHAALHVLHDLSKLGHDEELRTLVEAIEGDSPEVRAPLAANALLESLEG